jgi:hypothetical protein
LFPTACAINALILYEGQVPPSLHAVHFALLRYIYRVTSQLDEDQQAEVAQLTMTSVVGVFKYALEELPDDVFNFLPTLLLHSVQHNADKEVVLRHSAQQLQKLITTFCSPQSVVRREKRVLFYRPCWQLWQLGWSSNPAFRTLYTAYDILSLFLSDKVNNCILLTHDKTAHASFASVFTLLATVANPSYTTEGVFTKTTLAEKPDLCSKATMLDCMQTTPDWFFPLNPTEQGAGGGMQGCIHFSLLWRFLLWNTQCIQQWPDEFKDPLTDEYIVRAACLPCAADMFFEYDVLLQQLENTERNPYTNLPLTAAEFTAYQSTPAVEAALHDFRQRRAPYIADLVALPALAVPIMASPSA